MIHPKMEAGPCDLGLAELRGSSPRCL